MELGDCEMVTSHDCAKDESAENAASTMNKSLFILNDESF